MKKHGVLNRDISIALSKLGHTDRIVVADCGLPIPDHVTCVDLSLKPGVPNFLDVLSVMLQEMAVEKFTLAEEIKVKNQPLQEALWRQEIPVDYVTHEKFKKLTNEAKVIIRTGENTPYANVILHAGVIFS
ncbi:ribose transport protein RbsD [Gracilibacillus orientalis]|uniref:D-ribose pyranase n=1 Tax=Gracilibacillus orientalis TaxID=334253 RepID=A0A1I4R365_9BACI|nr:D-ribose pyranase [Gracilibacillus orientalis]SFM46707.1 ribose transport protein RbsD [Gracilibacillus orientalis]